MCHKTLQNTVDFYFYRKQLYEKMQSQDRMTQIEMEENKIIKHVKFRRSIFGKRNRSFKHEKLYINRASALLKSLEINDSSSKELLEWNQGSCF